MFLLTRRQTRATLAAAAGAATYLAASELGARKVKLTGLFIIASVAMAGMTTAQASVSAKLAHQRLDNFFNNGGSVGGDFYVNASAHVHRHFVNGFELTMNHGTPSVPGGGPLSYSASHDSALGTTCQDIVNVLSNSGISQ